jgi:hypothetical protein
MLNGTFVSDALYQAQVFIELSRDVNLDSLTFCQYFANTLPAIPRIAFQVCCTKYVDEIN